METRKTLDLKPHPLNAELYGDGCDQDLLESIRTKGILTPLLITKEGIVISGHRRLNAAQMLRLEEVPVNYSEVTDEFDLEEKIITANKQRIRTNEELAREFQKLKEIEERRAEQRRKAIQNNNTARAVLENFPELEQGNTRDIVVAKLGVRITGKTVEQASKVVRTIDTLKEQGQTQEAESLRTTLNKQSIHAAYQQAKPIIEQRKQQEQKKPELILTPPDPNEQKTIFNLTNDNIEWAKWSWNPVTGCLHQCPYCYAKDIAMRFQGDFQPRFHKERLNAPRYTKIPEKRKNEPGMHNVFVCSMADLFGEWVSQEWIDDIFKAVQNAPQWNFLFLTKNPDRYVTLNFPLNAWIGVTTDTQARMDKALHVFYEMNRAGRKPTVTFVSCEPLMESIKMDPKHIQSLDWLIIGGRSRTTGMEAGQPQWEWVESLLFQARKAKVKVYFKPNLTIQPKEYPQ